MASAEQTELTDAYGGERGGGMSPKIIWWPQPKQAQLISCPADDVGFGGARMGGKSDGILGDWLSHEFQYGQHAIGLVVRRSRTQLVELIERAKQIFTLLGFVWKAQDSTFKSPKGSRLRFAYLESDSDADAYQGHGYTRLYPEEMGTFPNEAPINKLQATLRSGHGVPCAMKSTFNPGGPGHQWVKSRYRLDKFPQGYEIFRFDFTNPFTKEKITKTRVFIPSRVPDNKYVAPDYVGTLQMVGSAQLVRAWLEGDWSIVDGAYFPEFSPEKHIIAPFQIPKHWMRFRSGDWGSYRPFCIGWYAVSDGSIPAIPRGTLVKYREWYGSTGEANIGLKLTAEEVAKGIVERETGEDIRYGVIDPSTYSMDGGPSIVERMLTAGCRFWRPADNTRITRNGAMGGWDQVRARLKGDGEFPGILFFSTCVDTIRTLPSMQHDQKRPEDLDSDSEDHALDEIRYACMSRPYVKDELARKPKEIDIRFPTMDELWAEQAKHRPIERI